MNLLYLVISIIFLYTVLFLTLNLETNSRWLIYIESLYRFGVIFAVMALIINNIQIDENNRKLCIDRINDSTNLGLITLNKTILNSYPESYEFARELNVNLIDENNRMNIDRSKKALVEMNIASIIFQSIENNLFVILNIRNMEPIYSDIMIEWISRWRTWFKSKTLNKIWRKNKSNFTKNTQYFIDRYIINQTHIYTNQDVQFIIDQLHININI